MSREATLEISERQAGLSAAKRALLERWKRGEEGASRAAEGERPPAIGRRSGDGPAPLTFLQQQLWFLDQLEPGNPAYTVTGRMRVSGRLRHELFERAVREVVGRHEVLRTVFRAGDGGPVQVVLPGMEIELPRIDLTGLPAGRKDAEARRRAGEEAERRFDLARGPLLWIVRLQLERDELLLLLSAHHAIADGWSLGVLVRELAALYQAFARGEISPLPPLPVQFADFAVWQRGQLAAMESDLDYWRRRLAAPPEGLELPADRPRPALQRFRGSSVPVAVPPHAGQALAALAREEEATPFMALLAGFLTLLLRHSGQADLLVATSVAGRDRPELERLIGLFINTLVLRNDLSGDPSFLELLRRVRQTSLEAFGHQIAPFERILEAVRPDRDLARNPLFQVMFLYQNLPPLPEVSLGGLSFRPEEPESRASMFDLTLALHERAGAVVGFLQYSSDLFDRSTARRLAARYAFLLERAVEAPGRPLSELPLLVPAERQQVLAEWNDTVTAYRTGVCLHELVVEQAASTPDAVAAEHEGAALTYAGLVSRARGLARRLGELGVEPEGRVGVLLERSLEMIVGLLGVLEAGAAYVPLDPSYPAERLAVLVEGAGISVVLAQERLAGLLPGRGERVVLLDAGEAGVGGGPGARPGDGGLAYVLYTSGSTGMPKGVMIPHRGIVNRLLWMQAAYTLEPADRVLQKTPFSFDVSLWELFWPLLVGARLVFARPEGHKDPQYLAELIAREGITTAHFVPSMLQAFLEAPGVVESSASLRRVVTSGEALPPELVRRFFARLGRAELHNLYGPTEASVDVSFWPCVAEPPRGVVPIGRPIANHRLHVMDRGLHAQPVGVPGELLLGGPGLARGYLARPELTAAAFVPDPFGYEPGGRLYRTGDLARHLPDGSVQFLGRIDHQVKIRGFRIELGEIEAVLGRHPSVRECAVLAREDAPGSRLLAAYVTGDPECPLEPAGLRAFLGKRLPEYMVPAAFVILESMPLNPNGKVDRKALPAPERTRAEAAGFTAPRDPLEEMIAGFWGELLGIERVGVHDDFFELGGHSLLATQVRSRLRDVLGVELPLRRLFDATTVERLAQAVRAEREGAAPAAEPLEPLPPRARAGDLPLSFAQQRLWLIDQLDPGSAAYNLPSAVRLTGRVSVPLLQRIFAEIVRRHESLRTTFPARSGRPAQVVSPFDPDWRPALPVVDLSALPGSAQEREARARELAGEEARRPFDLQRGPLLRLALVRLGEGEHVLLMTLHHVVSDGWSWGVLLREIGALYQAFAAGRPSPLPELPVQYADFAVWQRSWLQGEVLESQVAHWKAQLAGAPAVLELPTDRPRPAMPAHRGVTRPVSLPPALWRAVTALSRRQGATPFMALLAVWAAFLGRHAGEEDVLVGTPVAGRNRREIEGLIGFFVNTLVLRVDLKGSPGFRGLLERVREVALDAFTHQDLPFERLVDEVAPDRDLRRSPVFQVLFILQNAPLEALELPGLTLAQIPVQPGAAKFDLTLNLVEAAEGVGGFLEVDGDLFDEATTERFLARYETLLAAAAATPDRPLGELPLLPAAELHQVTAEPNATAEPFRRDLCVHELIAEQAARVPDAVAVSCRGEALSYGELAARADRLARRLAGLGVGPETLVGVCAERTPALLVALLAVLEAGGAWVPLDPSHPRDRLGFILADADAPVLLTERPLLGALPEHGARTVLLDGDAEAELAPPLRAAPESLPEGLAYVIYTSGSTGRPKGVAVRHRGVVNYLTTMAACPGTSAGDVAMATTTLAFDIAVTELLLPLTVGARVELVGRETAADPELLGSVLETAGATFMQATPATWALLVEAGWPGRPGLKALCGGEALPRHLAERLFPRVGELWNVYGPTETTVWSARCRVGPGGGELRPVPLGLPLGNTSIHLLGRWGEPVPLGAAGELVIGGEGLARGYRGRPELTAERFVPDPFGPPGARLYRTGDLARRLPDGALEFLGRLDFQVKVRGFRIELGEIEAVLAGHPGVGACVVTAREDGPGDKMLVAYVVPQGAAGDAAPEGSELRGFLAGKLPPYMLPAAFVTLEALPLSPNGKVDRKALPAPSRTRGESAGEPPRTAAETALARVWEEVLGVPRVSRDDNFFDLGGDSVLAVQVVFRAREAGLACEARDLFRHQSLAEVAAAAGGLDAPAPAEAPPSAEEPPPAGKASEPSPEDFPEARISQRDLDKLMARVGGRRGAAGSRRTR